MNSDRVAFFWSCCDAGMVFDYKQSHFKDISDVKSLFKKCKDSSLCIDNLSPSPMCFIYDEGWKFLIERFGYENLFSINCQVGWLNAENMEMFESDIANLLNKG